jgi:hypothetical protein
MDEKPPTSPFRTLGRQLKAMRDRAHETLAEASGAVEIDVKQLASYELGHHCPAEDVLLLLISHFGAKEDEAIKLWELAGYNMNKIPVARMTSEGVEIQAVPIQTADPRILFTDIVDVMVNNYGVVMNFMQSSGPQATPVTVARVGMSREHAKSVLQILQATISQTEQHHLKLPKNLAQPDNSAASDTPKK